MKQSPQKERKLTNNRMLLFQITFTLVKLNIKGDVYKTFEIDKYRKVQIKWAHENYVNKNPQLKKEFRISPLNTLYKK